MSEPMPSGCLAPAPETEADAPAPSRKITVLVVDDVELNRVVVGAMLAKAGGYDVHFAFDGVQAVEAYRRLQPDIVLMDMAMPNMDGLDATARIRQLETGAKRARVIGLTAYATADDRQICLDSGMDDYLTKPTNPKALKAALEG
ncbi:MAG TPA: response regulator [Rhizomicrobium sp.]|nr:response regulator [Rhizomicrobium sp.]